MRKKKIWFYLFGIWFVLGNLLFLTFSPWQVFYYAIWVGGFGFFGYRNRERLASFFNKIPGSFLFRFVLVGVIAVVIEEIFAGIATPLSMGGTTADIPADIFKKWILNLSIFTPPLIVWGRTLRRYALSPNTVAVIWGLLGILLETSFLTKHINVASLFIGIPLWFSAHALVYVFAGLAIKKALPTMSRQENGKKKAVFISLMLSIILPLVAVIILNVLGLVV